MPTYAACLLDVYETVLTVDNPARLRAIAEAAGVTPAALREAFAGLSEPLDEGRLGLADATAQALARCGVEADADRVARLLAQDRVAMRELTTVFDDVVPALRALREAGVRTAFVSNCSEDTGPLLADLGLSDLVDVVVLSHEVGSAKPAPRIFEVALEGLGVAAGDAVLVDDQPGFCEGAAAVGIRAVRIDRAGGTGEVADLLQALPLVLGPGAADASAR